MQRLVSEGASSANTPREAAATSGVEVMIVMVADHVQAAHLLFDTTIGAVEGLNAGATVVICSTFAPAHVLDIRRRLVEVGREDVNLIDAPVSGGAGRAKEGTLSVFMSVASNGDALTAGAGVETVLERLSGEGKLYRVPGGLGSGSKAKLIHQIFAGVHIALASEVMGLAASAGLDTRAVFAKINSGADDDEAGSWMFGNRVPHMLDAGLGRYSAVTIIAKDVGIITGTARQQRFPLPLVAVAERLYARAIGAGWGAQDDCVVVRLYLPGRPDLVRERAGNEAVAERSGPAATVSVGEVRDLLVGVHLAVVGEAMAFCGVLGVEAGLMFDIVRNAAGASRVFEKHFDEMREAGWGLRGVKGVEGIRERLVSWLFFFSPSFFLHFFSPFSVKSRKKKITLANPVYHRQRQSRKPPR